MLSSTFKLSLTVEPHPDFHASVDPRWEAVYSICEAFDGILMTPTSFQDAQGRILWSAVGEDEEDSDAVWPKVIAEVSINVPVRSSTSRETAIALSDTENIVAPNADQVARRALVLAALTARAMLEQHPENLDTLRTWKNRPRSRGLITRLVGAFQKPRPLPQMDLLAWIDAAGIASDVEPDEWEILQRPVGKLDEQMTCNSTWRLEGLVILTWALGRFELPPHDQLTEFYSMWERLGLLDADLAKESLLNPKLRTRDEISILRARLFAIHWRLRNFDLNREIIDFAKFAKECWFGPLDLTGLPLEEGDLSLGHKRLDKSDPDHFSAAHSTAQERHQAANWLWEGPAKYSDASVAT